MTKPRLIILDSERSTPTEEKFAKRLAQNLRSAKAPRVVVPLGGGPSIGFRPPNQGQQDAAKWKTARKQVLAALKRGEDVVLLGPLLDTREIDQSWATALAREGGADLIARRIKPQYGELAPDDDRARHDWPFQPYHMSDDGAGAARKLATAIEQKHPGAAALDDKGQVLTPAVYVIEDPKGTRRSVLSKRLADDTGAIAFDIDQMRKRIANSHPVSSWHDSPHKQRTIEKTLWAEVEGQAIEALRKGKPVILAGESVAKKTEKDVTDLLSRITDGETRRIRVQDQGTTAEDRGDGFFDMAWPEAPSLDQAAQQLAGQIMVDGNQPSLDDLLDLPPTDRRRPLKRRSLNRLPRP
ncbi:MAG: hypothetical protein Alpg2KO_05840 [Alphaproteobacteria bacterium]